jgi:hypothetical protein
MPCHSNQESGSDDDRLHDATKCSLLNLYAVECDPVTIDAFRVCQGAVASAKTIAASSKACKGKNAPIKMAESTVFASAEIDQSKQAIGASLEVCCCDALEFLDQRATLEAFDVVAVDFFSRGHVSTFTGSRESIFDYADGRKHSSEHNGSEQSFIGDKTDVVFNSNCNSLVTLLARFAAHNTSPTSANQWVIVNCPDVGCAEALASSFSSVSAFGHVSVLTAGKRYEPDAIGGHEARDRFNDTEDNAIVLAIWSIDLKSSTGAFGEPKITLELDSIAGVVSKIFQDGNRDGLFQST